jgi:two-component system sensor histidine kinase VanS
VDRKPGLSVRLKLALSYAAFAVVAGGLLLMAVGAALVLNRPSGWIIMTTDDTYLVGMFKSFAPAAAAAMAVLVVFGLVGGWFLAGRMLAPVDRMSEAVRLVGEGSLSHRVELPGRRDELRQLADAFDSMLAQLEAQVKEQRRFAANASHELRTPLAVTQSLLEVAQADPDSNTEELLERLWAVNARAIALTEALLTLSRAEQRAFTAEPVDLSLLAEEAAETLLPLAEAHDVAIDVSAEVALATGSRPLLAQMVLNLLHNAIAHNTRPGLVKVSAGAGGGVAVLIVENSGPELAPELVTTLTEPFQRGAERTHAAQAGVGLGLAIVKSIVQAHDGTLSLAARPGGGLKVTVHLRGV